MNIFSSIFTAMHSHACKTGVNPTRVRWPIATTGSTPRQQRFRSAAADVTKVIKLEELCKSVVRKPQVVGENFIFMQSSLARSALRFWNRPTVTLVFTQKNEQPSNEWAATSALFRSRTTAPPPPVATTTGLPETEQLPHSYWLAARARLARAVCCGHLFAPR